MKKTRKKIRPYRGVFKIPVRKHTPTEQRWLNPMAKKLPERENFEWIGWTTMHTPRAEGTFDNCTWHTPYKPLTFWQNIKYHIIWWKK